MTKKTILTCDFCNKEIEAVNSPYLELRGLNIIGPTLEIHFCNENCLVGHLEQRAKFREKLKEGIE